MPGGITYGIGWREKLSITFTDCTSNPVLLPSTIRFGSSTKSFSYRYHMLFTKSKVAKRKVTSSAKSVTYIRMNCMDCKSEIAPTALSGLAWIGTLYCTHFTGVVEQI